MKENKIKCRICESDHNREIKVGRTKLLQCGNCGLVFSNSIPGKDELKKYYTEDYNITSADVIETEKRRVFRLPEQLKLLAEISTYCDAPARVLDIGCDKGFFLDEARRFNYQVAGVEPSEKAREYCSNIGIQTYKDISDVEGKYDIVVMWHSLEHHADPRETLTQIHQLMNEGAYLFIRVPAFDSFWRRLLKEKWIWFQPENHYYHYSPEALRYLNKICGLELVRIEHRKPNDRFTKKMNRLVNSLFSQSFSSRTGLKTRLSRIYQDISGEELFSVARKK